MYGAPDRFAKMSDSEKLQIGNKMVFLANSQAFQSRFCPSCVQSKTIQGAPYARPDHELRRSITASPKQLIYSETVEEIQSVLRELARFLSPVRAMGSYHSLTRCASSDGIIVDMSRIIRVIDIDNSNRTFTAQAGLQFIEASKALRAHDLQFTTNLEIGNMTLGSAACCSKDPLDGIEFGRISSMSETSAPHNPSHDERLSAATSTLRHITTQLPSACPSIGALKTHS